MIVVPVKRGKFVAGECKDPRVEVIFYEVNQSVDGAVKTEFKRVKDIAHVGVVENV